MAKTDTTVKPRHKKGKVAPGKVNRNWRVDKGVDRMLHEEAARLGFDSVPAFFNTHFVRYFNGEVIQRAL